MRAWLPYAALAALREVAGKADGQELVSSLVESFDLDCWTTSCNGIALECAATDTVCGRHLACGAGPKECFGSATFAELSRIESDLFECGRQNRCAERRAPSSFVGSLDSSQNVPVDFEAFLTGMEEKAAGYLRNLGHTFYKAVLQRATAPAGDPDPTPKLEELRSDLKTGKIQTVDQDELFDLLRKIDLVQVGLQNSKGTDAEKAVMRKYIMPHLSLILDYVKSPPPPSTSSLIAMGNRALREQHSRIPDSLVQLVKSLGTNKHDLAADARRFDESFQDGYGKASRQFGLPSAPAPSNAGSLVESSVKPAQAEKAFPGEAAMSALVDRIAAYNKKLSNDFPGLPAGVSTPASSPPASM